MAKFKEGDLLVCIQGPDGHSGGSGWELGKIIIVGPNHDNDYVVWPVNGGNGIYEDWLEAVPEVEKVYKKLRIRVSK